jgi:elongation factor 1-alpha
LQEEDEKKVKPTIQDHVPVFNSSKVSDSGQIKANSLKQVLSTAHHLVDFIDNPGHDDYSRTAIRGLSGAFPDYAILVINSVNGVNAITKEHWSSISALDIPLIVVLTKMDLVPMDTYLSNREKLNKYMKSAGRKSFHIANKEDVNQILKNDPFLTKWSPVFSLSVKEGCTTQQQEKHNIHLLHHLLANLKPIPLSDCFDADEKKETPTAHFSVDSNFYVQHVGLVLSGVVVQEKIQTKSKMWLGPLLGNGNNKTKRIQHAELEHPYHFLPVELSTIHQNRQCIEEEIGKGHNCAVAITEINKKYPLRRDALYSGIYLIANPSANGKFDESSMPFASTVFEAKLHILHHATSIQTGFQSVLFVHMLRQTARVLQIKSLDGKDDNMIMIRSGDQAIVVLQFIKHAAVLHCGQKFVCREKNTKAVGIITKTNFTAEELEDVYSKYKSTKHAQKRLQRELKKKQHNKSY